MTAQARREVLSEHFAARMEGRKLLSAVFLTYRFEPGFFEQEVLPVFLDVSLSHAPAMRAIQLEDILRHLRGEIAVYYDSNGLVAGESGSPKLDVQRVPVRHTTGVFHPKNVILLVEQKEHVPDTPPRRFLLVACLSANLTRAGWWENVEVCHVEEITPDEPSRLRDDLRDFLTFVKKKAAPGGEHRALSRILEFLHLVAPRQLKSAGGSLHTHFFGGTGSLPGFLEHVASQELRNTYLEILSPYLDKADDSGPLRELVDRFQPKEVRVLLPRSPTGDAQCQPGLYDTVKSMPGVSWGRLPKDLLRLGKDEAASNRTVHAKLYRFFSQNPKREICFVGSANLTGPAFQKGGNVECGFLVDFVPDQRPDFWLTADKQKPPAFTTGDEVDAETPVEGSPLNVRFRWDSRTADLYWDTNDPPGELTVTARGLTLGVISDLSPRVWRPADGGFNNRAEDALKETSMFEVTDTKGKK